MSVDKVDGAEVVRRAYDVPFPVLADPTAAAHEAFEVINQLDEAMTAKLKGFGLDVEAWSGEEHHKVAVPSMFLLDRQRKVLWAHAAHDYKMRPKIPELLPALTAALPTP